MNASHSMILATFSGSPIRASASAATESASPAGSCPMKPGRRGPRPAPFVVRLLPKAELLNKTLFLSLDHARAATDRWVADYNLGPAEQQAIGGAFPLRGGDRPLR